jgi:hypothetical protein
LTAGSNMSSSLPSPLLRMYASCEPAH